MKKEKKGLFEMKFEQIFDYARVAIFVVDIKNKKIVSCNKTAEKLVGRKKRELIGLKQEDLHPKEKRGWYKKQFLLHIKKGHAIEFEAEVLHKSGKKIPVLITSQIFKKDHDSVIIGLFIDISKQKEIEKSLKENKELLGLQIKRMPMGCILWGKDFRVQMWNPAAKKIFGFSYEEALGNHPYDLIVPKSAQKQVTKIWRRLLKGDTSANLVNENITKKGDKIICDWTNTPIKKDNGTIMGVLSMIRDITEGEKTKSQVEEVNKKIVFSELSYRRLFEAAQDGILLVDFKTGMIMDVNKFLIDLLDYSKKDFLQKHLWEVGIFKDVVASKENFKTLQKKRYVRFEDLPLETKKGKKVEVEFVANAYQVDNKTIIQCNIRDITKRKKTEAFEIAERKKNEILLEESEKRLASIIEFLPDATFVIDLEGKAVAWNKATEEMTKVKAKDVLSKGNYAHAIPFYGKRRPVLADLILNPKILAKINKGEEYSFITKEGETLVTEKLLKNVGGKDIFVWAKATPLYDTNGKLFGAVESVRDITKEKELDNAKSEFVSMASHQLRTPLSSIKWTLESLKGINNLSEQNQEKIKDIYDSNERLISLVNNLLNITRIESGKMLINKTKNDLIKLIKESCKGLEEHASKRKQKIQYLFKGAIGKVFVDPILFSEAFCNLLSNAVNYGFEKSKITIRIERDKEHYLISVHNFGLNIIDSEKSKIFTKFYRGPGSPAHNFSGSGLGLFFTKATVEANGGKIWFESKKGKGTTFYFTVPIK